MADLRQLNALRGVIECSRCQEIGGLKLSSCPESRQGFTVRLLRNCALCEYEYGQAYSSPCTAIDRPGLKPFAINDILVMFLTSLIWGTPEWSCLVSSALRYCNLKPSRTRRTEPSHWHNSGCHRGRVAEQCPGHQRGISGTQPIYFRQPSGHHRQLWWHVAQEGPHFSVWGGCCDRCAHWPGSGLHCV